MMPPDLGHRSNDDVSSERCPKGGENNEFILHAAVAAQPLQRIVSVALPGSTYLYKYDRININCNDLIC